MGMKPRTTLRPIKMQRFSKNGHTNKLSLTKAATPKDSVSRPRALLGSANVSSDKSHLKVRYYNDQN